MGEFDELVRQRARVRIFSGTPGHRDHAMAEGEVIGYVEAPTLLIRHDDGTQSSWPVTLPREVVRTLAPEPPEGSYALVVHNSRGFAAPEVGGDGLRREVWERPYRLSGMPEDRVMGWVPCGAEGREERTWAELHSLGKVVELALAIDVTRAEVEAIDFATSVALHAYSQVRGALGEERFGPNTDARHVVDVITKRLGEAAEKRRHRLDASKSRAGGR